MKARQEVMKITVKCVQRKLDIAGTAVEMHVLLFLSIKRPFQILVAHFIDHFEQ